MIYTILELGNEVNQLKVSRVDEKRGVVLLWKFKVLGKENIGNPKDSKRSGSSEKKCLHCFWDC